jgi:hypothetical protein
MFELGDNLLYVLSAWSQLTWARFREAFDELAVRSGAAADARPGTELRFRRDATRRTLHALGHIEYGAGHPGDRIYIARPCLMTLPAAGLPTAVLVGARAPATAGTIRATVRGLGNRLRFEAGVQGAPWGFAPARLAFEGNTTTDLEELAAALGVSFAAVPTTWLSIVNAHSVSDYLAELSWESQSELTWPREDFNPQALSFTRDHRPHDDLRLSRYQDPIRGSYHYLLWRQHERAGVDVDWARWAVLSANGIAAMRYESAALRVTLPVTVPLPAILSRAAALCSGRAPTLGHRVARSAMPGTLTYEAIPPDVYAALASRLGQPDIRFNPGEAVMRETGSRP